MLQIQPQSQVQFFGTPGTFVRWKELMDRSKHPSDEILQNMVKFRCIILIFKYNVVIFSKKHYLID